MFKNWKITTRLIATLSLLGAVILGIAAMAILQMVSMVDSTREITTNWLPSIEAVSSVDGTFSDFRVAQYAHVLNTDNAAMALIEKEITEVKAKFETQRAAYAKLISSNEERKLYESFSADWATYLQLHEKMIELSRRNENDAARAILEKEIDPLFDRASETVQKLVVLNHEGSVGASETAEAAYSSARTGMLLVVLAAMSVAAVAGVWLVRSIGGPLRAAVAAADRVAAGDFSVAIEAEGHDEAAQVLQALARMQAGLSDVVYSVRSNSESVATASAQIAQGNQDLSQRTEEQASALEETAATMEELGSTVRSNADNARQANQLAQAASGAATQGGEMVLQVVNTMQGISESSRKIGDIIGVIDGIAFQTNILALNAAVEAARAGEQGRGFAVVAGEVRTLAQRSAEAAKEIRALISRNVEQVEQGTTLVDRAGKSMEDIVSSIRKVSDIVGEISSAATEQSSGIQQVGEAVGQMDQVTQQNAALVEESAAAAESLKTQAEQLVQAVSVFKLSVGQRAASPAAMPAAMPAAVPTAVVRPAPAANKPVVQKAAPAVAAPSRDSGRKETAVAAAATTAAVAAESDEWATF